MLATTFGNGTHIASSMRPRRRTCSYYALACPLLPPRCPRWSSALSQLRQAFFPADKRIGGTWVWSEGVVGILRAVLLVAKVGVPGAQPAI